MSYQFLLVEKKDGGAVATVTVNREKAMNALNPDVLKEIQACFTAISEDPEVRVAIITGAGEKAFIAGADIAAMSKMSVAEASEFGKLGHGAMNAIDRCAKPVIAAVNGFCLGGGSNSRFPATLSTPRKRQSSDFPKWGSGSIRDSEERKD